MLEYPIAESGGGGGGGGGSSSHLCIALAHSVGILGPREQSL